MSIAGNFNTMQPAELLQWLSNGHKTGTLVITDGSIEKKIFFRGGRIFSSASTDPKEYLGHFLVSRGLITEVELSQAIEMQESNQMLLGKILVTIGAVSEPDLQRLLRLKAEESIYDIFSWDEAEFRFFDGDVPSSNLIPIDLDVPAIVLEGARRADEWARIRSIIPTMDAIPVWIGDITDPDLDPGERQILKLINDDRTVEEICLQTHSTEYHVCKVLHDQVERGRVKIIRPRWSTQASPTETRPQLPLSGETLVKAAREFLRRAEYEAALRHLRAARSLEPEDKKIQQFYEEAEAEIRAAVERAGVRLDVVPKLTVDINEITGLDLTPQQGFILTRINDSYDLKSILKISPMQQVDGLLVFWRLFKAGYIRFG